MKPADIVGALAIAALLTLPAGVAELLRGAPDRRGESIAARDALAAARSAHQREAAARAICAEALGENSAAVWQADGSMRCADKRGRYVRSLNSNPARTL